MKRTVAVMAFALVSCGLGQTASVASAFSQPVPEEVLVFVDEELIQAVKAIELEDDNGALRPVIPQLAGITTGNITQINLLTEPFQAGQSNVEALTAINEWLVPLYVEADPIGTATVLADSGHASLIDTNLDTDLASGLSGVGTDQRLIFYPQAREYYAFDGSTVFPVDAGAREFLVQPVAVSTFQAALQHRVSVADSNSNPGDNLVGVLSSTLTVPDDGPNWLTILGICSVVTTLLVAGVAMTWNRKDKAHTTPRKSVG